MAAGVILLGTDLKARNLAWLTGLCLCEVMVVMDLGNKAVEGKKQGYKVVGRGQVEMLLRSPGGGFPLLFRDQLWIEKDRSLVEALSQGEGNPE